MTVTGPSDEPVPVSGGRHMGTSGPGPHDNQNLQHDQGYGEELHQDQRIDMREREMGGLSPSPSHQNGHTGSSRSSGDDHLTLRRREANRLAAQRFRSRKKGYQDSLEEKVRQLEDEKEALHRRLSEVTGIPHHPTPRVSFGLPTEDEGRQAAADRPGNGGRQSSYNGDIAASPERQTHSQGQDPDVRIAGLEAANRRLQEELRNSHEEAEALRHEVDRWRRWDQELMERETRMEQEKSFFHSDTRVSNPIFIHYLN